MEQDIIIQPIRCNRVVHIVVLIGIPVFRQLFGTQHQNRLVSILIILYDCQCGKGLIDDSKHRILLEVVQQTPDFALLESGCLIRQFVFRDVVQKLAEHMIQRHKVDELRGIFSISRADILQYYICDILHFMYCCANGASMQLTML